MTRTAEQAIHTLEIAKEQEIAAPIEIVFETLLEHPSGRSMKRPRSRRCR